MDSWILKLINGNHGSSGIIIYVLIVMLAAALCSFLIGIERQLSGEPAGIRTHALLSMGCALLMIVSIWAIRIADGTLDISSGSISDVLNYDTSRIAAGVVTGMGFLGGGVIIKDKFTVKGLSTASTLWICAAVGLACGAGFIIEAVVAAVLTFVLLLFFNKLVSIINLKSPSIIIKSDIKSNLIADAINFSEQNRLALKDIAVLSFDNNIQSVRFSYAFTTKKLMLEYMKNHFSSREDVTEVDVINVKKANGKNCNE